MAPAFELLDLSGPLTAFNIASDLQGNAAYTGNVVSAIAGPVRSCAGLSMEVQGPEAALHGDTANAVGGPEAVLPDGHAATADLLRALAGTTRRMASVCTGAFYLAQAGVLRDHRATTHWRWAPRLQARFPTLTVDADRIYVRDREVWTSAGLTAGIDLALAMIDADFGPELAKAVAREMVVYHRRLGGQSQFSAVLEMDALSDRVRAALSFARDHLHEDLPVERLARAACVSSRQFGRVFRAETGETPARAVERLRVDAARPQVEDSQESIERIAREVGFGDAEKMRRSFQRVFGRSPQALRRLARGQGLAGSEGSASLGPAT